MATLYSSNLDGATVGSIAPGWASISGGWKVGTNYPVSGANTFGPVPGQDGDLAVYTSGSTSQANQYWQVSFYYIGGSIGYPAPVCRCSADGQNGYMALLDYNSGKLYLYARLGGTYVALAFANAGIDNGQNITVEVSAVGTTIEGRVWPVSGSRPTSPTVSATHADLTAGTVGIYWSNIYSGVSSGADNLTWVDSIAAAATSLAFTGAPATGTAGVASSNFTVAADGTPSGNVVVTPNDGGAGGTFTPATVTLTPASQSATFTYTAASAGAKTISLTNNGGLANPASVTFTAAATAATAVIWGSIPSSGTTGYATSAFNVGVNGTLSGNVVVTPSDGGAGGTFSPTYVTLNSGTPTGAFTYTPASAGNKTISLSNNSGLSNPSGTTISVSSSSGTIAVDDANITWSPANWDTLNIGDYGVSVKSKQTTACGAYFKFSVTGTTSLSLALDTTPTAGFGNANMPRLLWFVGGGAAQYAQPTDGATSLTLATGLTAGNTYVVEVYLLGTNELMGDRWGINTFSPTNALRVAGITIDGGGSVLAHPQIHPNKLVFYGDSIIEGVRAAGTTTEPGDHGRSAPWFVGPAMNCEYGVIGYGATGWSQPGSGNVLPLPNAWNYHCLNRARSLAGVDYLFVMLGYNGGATQAEVQNFIAAVRAAYPSLWIFIVCPPSGRSSANMIAAVSAYKAVNPGEARVASIDFSDRIRITNYCATVGPANFETVDGAHPFEWANAMIAAAIVQKAQAIISAASAATPARFVARMPWRGR